MNTPLFSSRPACTPDTYERDLRLAKNNRADLFLMTGMVALIVGLITCIALSQMPHLPSFANQGHTFSVVTLASAGSAGILLLGFTASGSAYLVQKRKLTQELKKHTPLISYGTMA